MSKCKHCKGEYNTLNCIEKEIQIAKGHTINYVMRTSLVIPDEEPKGAWLQSSVILNCTEIHGLAVDVKYCPMCGRKLIKGDNE